MPYCLCHSKIKIYFTSVQFSDPNLQPTCARNFAPNFIFICPTFYIYLPHIAYVARVGEKNGGVASNWHRLHAARHHHKETRRRQKFFNFCYNFYHLQLPQPVPATATAPVPVWIPSLVPPLLGNPPLL